MFLGLFLRVGRKIANRLRANVARHNDDRVLEAHHAALAVGQAAIVEHLQQNIEDVGVRLLDFVEQNHAIRTAANGLGELAALVIAHVSRRGTDQALHAELLHVFRHVDTHHGALGVEQVFSERLRELGFANARGTQEQEAANGPVGVGKPRAIAANGAGNRRNGLILAHDALMQLVFQVNKLGHFALHHLRHGNARPRAHDFGDFLVGNFFLQNGAVALLGVHGLFGLGQLTLQLGNLRIANLGSLHQVALARGLFLVNVGRIDIGLQGLHLLDDVFLVAPFGLARIEPFFRRGHLLAQLFQALGARRVAFLHERLFLDLHLRIFTLSGVDFLRHGVNLDAQAAGGFVHKVNGLIGKEAVGNVAVRKLGRSDDCRIGDAHAVVDFVLLLQAAQNGDGVFHGGLAHEHRLETALKRGIFLDVFAVLVERGRADSMQFAARQCGLEHVARVHRRIARGTSAHDGMQLVDEQNDAAVALLHFTQNRLQTILELAAVLRARNHSAQVKRDNIVVFQARRHVACNDSLGQALDDCRFANARLANKHRVVLRATRKHLNGAANLVGTADDRIKLALARLLSEVLAVLVQRIELGFALLVGHTGVAAKVIVGLLDVFARHARAVEDFARLALVFGKGNEQMLARRVGVAHLFGGLHRVVNSAHEALRRKGHAHHAARDLGAIGDGLVDFARKHRRVGAHALDDGRDVVLARIEQGFQQMNRLDRRRVGVARDAHSGLEGLLSGYCKFVESHKTISFLDGENWFRIKPVKRYEHLTGWRANAPRCFACSQEA